MRTQLTGSIAELFYAIAQGAPIAACEGSTLIRILLIDYHLPVLGSIHHEFEWKVARANRPYFEPTGALGALTAELVFSIMGAHTTSLL